MAYSHSGDGEDVEEIFEGMSYGIVQVLGGFQTFHWWSQELHW